MYHSDYGHSVSNTKFLWDYLPLAVKSALKLDLVLYIWWQHGHTEKSPLGWNWLSFPILYEHFLFCLCCMQKDLLFFLPLILKFNISYGFSPHILIFSITVVSVGGLSVENAVTIGAPSPHLAMNMQSVFVISVFLE